MTMFNSALARVKREYESLLPESTIAECLQLCGFQGRRRILTPVQSVYLLLLQLLHHTALTGLRHVSGIKATASAICQARSKLPLRFLHLLVDRATAELVRRSKTPAAALFCGLEVLLVDGFSAQSQDIPELATRYRKPRNQHGTSRGYPTLKLVCLVHYATGLITRLIDLPGDRQEHMVLGRLLEHLTPGRILVGDRGMASFAFLARLIQQGAHACLRLSANHWAKEAAGGSRRIVQTLAHRHHLLDQLVCWRKSSRPCRSLSQHAYAALPGELTLRQICYRLTRAGFRPTRITVITTLLDPTEYPAEQIAELYLQRWQIEVYFRDLKHSQGLWRLRAKSLAGARKELLGHVLVYNLVRGVMREAAERQGVTPDRLSFRDALRQLRHATAEDELRYLLVNPRRRRLAQPRRIKYVNFRYPTLRKPRAVYQKQLNKFPTNTLPLT
jgi:hypothetical protein